MKHLMVSFVLLLTVSSLSAQRDRTLFSGNNRTGFFGAPIFEYYDFGEGGDFEVASGGGGALILGDFFIGGYGLGDINLIEIIEEERANIDLGHAGLWFGATPFQQSALHPYLSVRAGWGAADIEIDDNNFSYNDRFFIISPEVGLEVNVFRWFRIAATAGYQWYNGLDDTAQFGNEIDLNNLRAGLTLRFGAFGRKRNNW
ncbi:MAG: hypothetical protein AAF849_05225 [Bacteroidota bacterium]